ncbi:MAG: hypothetical protein CMC05_01335 [Flavobacteriaceae bacterium]|nr:hypothetical protein [Flavobacteriaceae bacterium]|tara:strand:- start:209 stop:973 length:765 start_codon:yes stop_codon:yes gene_type:complete
MSKSKAFLIIETRYGNEIAQKLMDSYKEIEENFVIQKWKPSELDSGHFVESARRIIEFELFGSYTPYSSKLSTFSDSVINSYQNASGNESFRMLIPRTLKAIFNIRNKRGVGHVGLISPNKMDATYIFYSVKWVLAEIIRLASGLSTSETQLLVDKITERNLDVIWKSNGFHRILNPKLSAKNQVLILLFDESPRDIEKMRETIEYKNKPNFIKLVLEPLHKLRLIEMNINTGVCEISPSGRVEAEEIILKQTK